MKKTILFIITSVISGLSGAYIYNVLFPNKETVYYSNSAAPVGFTSNHHINTTKLSEDFVGASALATPSVVYITTVSSRYNQYDWFDWYFNGRGGQSISSGSGVIYSADGYIITNSHVIDQAEKIEVVHEKKSYAARLIGKDPSSDLAVLKIEGQDLPAVRFGSSANVKVGEWVLAVGNPFNLTSTVTAGIVSAKGRHINVVNSQFPLESFIQTDAAINPGNSGGALVNTKGELIGINTAILSQTGSYTGYGFAVPADIVSKIVKDLIKYGEVQKAFFGADVSDINASIAKQFDLKEFSGVAATYIQAEGAADKIGLKKGDVIFKLNDATINSRSAFDEYLSYFNPGDKIKVTYKRGEKISEQTITLTNREGTTTTLKRETFTSEKLGADLEAISKVEKDKLGVAGGVRITNIKNGLIRRLGLTDGFIILSINNHIISAPEELVSRLEQAQGRIYIEGISSNGTRGIYSYYF
ncbi:MAG: trypsin-like peptidase domain-containing protein [Cytophagaceae bacterium]|nr:trypsin-like peptidase domain-containing protein [Cytophagaceae bacterium]